MGPLVNMTCPNTSKVNRAIIVAMLYHVWVGMRDIWMDYIKPVGMRLGLQVFTIVWLTACAGWGIQVLWRV